MKFQLKVYRASEGVTRLTLEAADLVSARDMASTQGYTVLGNEQPSWLQKRLKADLALTKRFSVALFAQELLALLEAGLALVEAIGILANKSRALEQRRILETLHRQLQEGNTFSQALDSQPSAFTALFVATVRASERTGNLNEAMRRFLAYHRQVNSLRDKMLSASVYPALLVFVGGLVVLFLLGYVVPRFSRVYEDIGEDRLPFLSRVLMHWGQWAGEHTLGLGLVFLLMLFTVVFALLNPVSQTRMMHNLWRLPYVGERLRIYQLARFTRTVSMLLAGGVPLVSALDMTESLLPQPALKEGLRKACQALREGHGVSDTFAAHGLATEVGTRLLVVGERSGELAATMEKIATFYDEEIARDVDWFTRMFEPVLMVVMGMLIGGIVILMYMPIFELAGSIQ